VDMRIDLGAAVFKKGADVVRMSLSRGSVACERGMSGSSETRSDARGILVKYENGKDVSEDHADDDETDAAEKEKAARAERRKRLIRDCSW